jgi:NifB/MoaA-like Fe-S oxidoreductase
MPAVRAYAGYPQYENGIGMVRSWQDDLARRLRRWERQRQAGAPPRATFARATVVTGELFGPVLQETARAVAAQTGLDLRVVPVINEFLGDSVTVAGLIGGRDMLRQLQGMPVGDRLLVPARALDQRGEVFLDGVSVAEVARTVGAPVFAGREFADLLRLLDLPV